MKNKKRIVTLGAAAMATIAVLGGTFAYFTGYDSKDLTADAGILTVELTDATEDLTNGLTIINPGDSNPLTFTVSNTGEKSVDVKAVMKVTAPKAFTESAHEFRITDDKGVELTGELSADKQTITYNVTDITLAGSIENDTTLDGTTDTTHKFDYRFAMDSGAKNAWQDVTGTVKIEVYAKQHRNTSGLGSDWVSIVEKE